MDITKPDTTTMVLDFNYAYNPYCAYTDGYSCPITPKENYIDVEVNAGIKGPKDIKWNTEIHLLEACTPAENPDGAIIWEELYLNAEWARPHPQYLGKLPYSRESGWIMVGEEKVFVEQGQWCPSLQ